MLRDSCYCPKYRGTFCPVRRIDFEPGKALLLRFAEELTCLLGFATLPCGCVIGKYREVATSREIRYVEEKGKTCASHGHRRNHTISTNRLTSSLPIAFASKAS